MVNDYDPDNPCDWDTPQTIITPEERREIDRAQEAYAAYCEDNDLQPGYDVPEPDEPDSIMLPYPGEGDPRSMGMDAYEYATWAAEHARPNKIGGRAKRRSENKAKWRADQLAREQARKGLDPDSLEVADRHAMNKHMDDWLADPKT